MTNDPSSSDQPASPRQPIDPAGTSAPPPPPPGYVPAVYVQGHGAGKGVNKVLTYLLFVGLLVSVTLNIHLYGPVRTIAQALAGGLQEQQLDPEVKKSELDNRIVIVNISGTINGSTAAYATDAFYRLTKDKPAAVVLRVE